MNVKKRMSRTASLVAAIVLFAGSLYALWVVVAPQLEVALPPSDWNEPVPYTSPQEKHTAKTVLKENRLYIPKLKLNLPYKSGDASVLADAVWHRYPERGNPENGGNFILAGHRFELGLTPGETRVKSPFYRLDQIGVGDRLFVDYNGARYSYVVSKRYTVKPDALEIEAPTKTAKMTLYSCTFGGTWDGREVLEARPDEKLVDPSVRIES